MRSPITLCACLLVTAAWYPRASSAEPDVGMEPPRRARLGCARLRARLDRTAKSLGAEDRIKPNSWGNVPAELRKLPAGAELCGVDEEGQAVIQSPLYGRDLEAHYAPLFARY